MNMQFVVPFFSST